MQEVRREVGVLSDTVQGIGHVGRNMTLAVTAPIAALGFSAVRSAGEFDAAMRNINSIALLSESQLADLSARTLELGASIRSGPQAAAEALYTVFSAGITDVNAAFNVMKVGAKTAEAGLADLTKTTEGLVAAALTFGDQSPKALQEYSDAITLAVQLGVGNMDTFNTGFANVMGTAAAVGQSFEEMAAVTAFLTQRGIQAGAAGTYLNNALTKLIKPTEDMSALWTRLGVKSGKDLLKTFGGFIPALRAIYKEIGNNEAAWAKLFNDVRGFKAVSRIFTAFEADGIDAVSAFFDEFDTKMAAGGLTMSAWEQQMMSFEAQWGLLTSAVQGFAITVGSLLLPILTPIISGFRDLLLQIQQADPVLLKVGLAFTLAAAAAGPLLWIIGSLSSPVTVLIGLAAGLAVAWETNWNGIRDTTARIVTEVLGPLDDLKKGIEIFFQTLFGETQTTQPTDQGNKTTATTVRAPVTFELLPAYDKNFKGIAELAKQHGVTIDDILKALGFKTLKEAMGAKPGKYTINFDLELVPSTNQKKLFAGQQEVWEDAGGIGGKQPDNSIGGRLAAAIDAAWPVVQPALERLLNRVKTWFTDTFIPGLDEKGGDVLNTVAGWFSGSGSEGGETPVYNALRDLLNTDIGNAAADVGTIFNDNFPRTREGLNNFAVQFGNWFTTEAVPTVARSIGYFAGTLVGLLIKAVPAAFQTLAGTNVDTAGVTSFVNDSLVAPLGEGIQQGLSDQGLTDGVTAAVEAAWPTVQSSLDQLLTRVKDWVKTTFIPGVDSAGGGVLNSVAGWFSGSGDENGETPVYTAIRNLLNTDIGKAASDVGTLFDDNFPKTKEGLTNFATKFGDWFTNEAVPTVSRSIGYFAGTVVSLIAQAIPAAFSLITGGAGAAPGAAADLSQFVGDKVLEPMRQGIQQSIADRGIGGGDAIVTSFATQLVLLFAGNKLLTALIGQDIGGKILGKIVAAIAATDVAKSVVGAEGTLLNLGQQIGNKVVVAIAGVITSPITVGITLGTLLYIAIPQQWKDALHNAFSNLIDMAFGEGATENLLKNVERAGYQAVGVIAGITGDKTLEQSALVNLNVDLSPETLEQAKNTAGEYQDYFFEELIDAFDGDAESVSNLSAVLDSTLQSALTEVMTNPSVSINDLLTGLFAADEKLSLLPAEDQARIREALIATINAALEQPITVDPPKIEIAGTQGEVNTTAWADIMSAALAEGVGGAPGTLPKPSQPMMANIDDMIVWTPESAQRSVDSMSNLVNSTIDASVAAGNFNGQSVADSLVKPIETAFQTAFGEGGTVNTAWNTFITNYMTKSGALALNFVTLGIAVNILKGTFISAFQTMRDKTIQLIGEITQHVAGLNTTITGIGNALGGAAQATGVVGGGSPVPQRASGGTLDGFGIVGERGPEPVFFGSKGMVMPTRILRDALRGTGGGTTVNNIQINGVRDVDGLLFELERRGIKLA